MTITPATAPIKQTTYRIENLQGKVLQKDIHSYAEARIAALKQRSESGAPVQIKES